MFYRPDMFRIENADSFVCSKFFDFEADRQDEKGLVNMNYQLRTIMYYILQLAKLNRSTEFINKDEQNFQNGTGNNKDRFSLLK